MRPLTTGSKRTLQMVHAFDLAVSTIPDLEDGEAVELDATHGGDGLRCVVRRMGDAFDVMGAAFDMEGVSARIARQGFAGVWLAVEEDAPGVTHATVLRFGAGRP